MEKSRLNLLMMNSLNEDKNNALSIEKDMINIFKENMIQEKKRNLEVTQILKDQINYLKNDIIHKNTLIETLIVEISSKNTDSTFVHSTPEPTDDNYSDMSSSIVNVHNGNTLNTTKSHAYRRNHAYRRIA